MFYPDLKLVVLGTTETLNTLGGASKTFIAPGCKTVKKKSRSSVSVGLTRKSSERIRFSLDMRKTHQRTFTQRPDSLIIISTTLDGNKCCGVACAYQNNAEWGPTKSKGV